MLRDLRSSIVTVVISIGYITFYYCHSLVHKCMFPCIFRNCMAYTLLHYVAVFCILVYLNKIAILII